MTNHTTPFRINKAERVYALDALRGIMMLLGILLHAACTYCLTDLKESWPLKAPANSFVFDILIAYIHAFRMPVFFITSGFFVAVLIYNKGLRGMINNRTKRILLPFLAALMLISPFVEVSFAYAQMAFRNENLTLEKAGNILFSSFPVPSSTHHLWFLYFLIIYVFVTCLLSVLFQNFIKFTAKYRVGFKKVIQNLWLRFLALSFVLFIFLNWMKDPFIVTSNSWMPDLPSLLLYFFLFLLGFGIFKTNSLSSLTQRPLLQIFVASFLVLVFVFIPWPIGATWVLPVQQAMSASFSTLLIFGFIALFLTYFNRFSARLTYLMDAAYWVYLIHLPIVVVIPGLLAHSSIPLIAIFFIVLISTTAICFISYHLFVRNSFIGMFLNGKVHKEKKGTNELLFQQPQLSK